VATTLPGVRVAPVAASSPEAGSVPQEAAAPDQPGPPSQEPATQAAPRREISGLAAALSEQLRTGVHLLRWCADRQAAARAPACAELRRSAAQASLDLSLSTSQMEPPRAEQLRAALGRLQRQIAAIRDVAEVRTVPMQVPPPAAATNDPQAALIRTVRQLPDDFARHSVPAAIGVNGSETATVAVNPLTADEIKGVGRLHARLTVVEGDAVEVVGVPKAGARFMWVWTLVGLHAGEANVRTELFIDPPPEGAAGLTPVRYQTWEDHVTVDPALLMARTATRGAGVWLLLGAAIAGVMLAGLWLRFRQGDIHVFRRTPRRMD
jgi:hypothetical protein